MNLVNLYLRPECGHCVKFKPAAQLFRTTIDDAKQMFPKEFNGVFEISEWHPQGVPFVEFVFDGQPVPWQFEQYQVRSRNLEDLLFITTLLYRDLLPIHLAAKRDGKSLSLDDIHAVLNGKRHQTLVDWFLRGSRDLADLPVAQQEQEIQRRKQMLKSLLAIYEGLFFPRLAGKSQPSLGDSIRSELESSKPDALELSDLLQGTILSSANQFKESIENFAKGDIEEMPTPSGPMSAGQIEKMVDEVLREVKEQEKQSLSEKELELEQELSQLIAPSDPIDPDHLLDTLESFLKDGALKKRESNVKPTHNPGLLRRKTIQTPSQSMDLADFLESFQSL